MSHLGFFKDPAGLADGSYAFHSLKGGGANFSFREFKPDFLHQFHLFNFLLKFQYIKLHLTSGGKFYFLPKYFELEEERSLYWRLFF